MTTTTTTITITNKAACSANYGGFDRRTRISLKTGWKAWASTWANRHVVAICPVGVSPPPYIPNNHGGLYGVKWRELIEDFSIHPCADDVVVLAFEWVHEPTGSHEFFDVLREIGAENSEENLEHYKRKWGFWVEVETDQIEGALAPMTTEQQNLLADVALGGDRR